MRPNIHPDYRHVVFQDPSTGDAFLTRSTATSGETVVWKDGNRYPLIRVDVSKYSHPFWTGQGRVVDTEGRVEAFRRRYGARRG